MPYIPTDPHVAQAQYVAKTGSAVMAVVVKIKRDGTYVVASYGEDRGLCDAARQLAGKIEETVKRHFSR